MRQRETILATIRGAKLHRGLAPSDLIHSRLHRDTRADIATGDGPGYPGLLSSEFRVNRGPFTEELVHTPEAVDLSAVPEDGLPLLWGHDLGVPIGRARDLEVRDGALYGRLEFSPHTDLARSREAEVRDGFLGKLSLGYTVLDAEVGDDDLIRVTRWQPYEASLVTVPRDPTAGVIRGQRMQRGADDPPPRQVDPAVADQIVEIFTPYLDRGPSYARALQRALRAGSPNVERASLELIRLLGEQVSPLGQDSPQHQGVATGGTTAGEKFHRAAVSVVLRRAGIRDEQDDPGANPYHGYTLRELVRESLKLGGVTRAFRNPHEMIGESFIRAGVGVLSHGTGDFANIVLDAANKAALRGWTEAEETWRTWCRIGEAPDYRQLHRVNLSSITDLQTVPENGEFPLLDASDVREILQILKYGGRVGITREAVVNDDVSLFTTLPRKLGRAGARVPGNLAYAVLTAGTTATLNQDGVALFHASHSNYVAPGSGAVPSVATVTAAQVAMATQTDPQGNTLGIVPRYLICPIALRNTAQIIATSVNDPAITPETPNPVSGTFSVVADHRLDADDPAAWYMAAAPGTEDTVEVVFLQGMDSPQVESETAWSRDGTEFKVRIECDAGPLDFRGLYKNDGN